tara:strand:- start:1279 stop:1626 length:348 start_codon:yes stop_codon:yes gene_type:complete
VKALSTRKGSNMNNGITTNKEGVICLDGNKVIGQFTDQSGHRYFSELSQDEDNLNWGLDHGATHLIEARGDLNWACRYARVLKTVVHVLVDVDSDNHPVWESWPIKNRRTFRAAV